MHFPAFAAERGHGADRLVVGLASSGGEKDLPRGGADHGGDILTCFFKEFLCFLPV